MSLKVSHICLDDIEEVVFFKRDELTTDLLCCEVVMNAKEDFRIWFSHEEAAEWDALIAHIEDLPEFDREWREKVILPVFVGNRTVAFRRNF